MRQFGLGHVLVAAAFVIIPGAAIAVSSPQSTSSGDNPSDDWLPFELGRRSPEHEGSDALVGADWTEDPNDPDPDGSTSSDEPRGGGSDSRAPIVESLSASGIPEVALRAYGRGQETMARDDARCNLPWSLLAAIGRVETNHGRYGGAQLREDGSGTKPIRGMALDGRPGVALIRDTDNGELDDDITYDRAVGPMQFIPSTWNSVAADGNGDGDQDPDNIFDAVLAASLYLCSGDTNLDDDDHLTRSVFRYNRSQEYVDLVLSLAEAYENGFAPDLPDPGPTETPTEPLPEPVPDPANEGVPPGLSELSGPGEAGSPSSATTSTAPRRRSPSTTTPSATAPTSTTSTTTTTTTTPTTTSTTTTTTPTTTVPPDPDDPVQPECPDPGDSTSGGAEATEPVDPKCCASEPDDSTTGGAEATEPVDPECCASEPDDVDELPGLETTTTSAPPNDADTDEALPPECCTDGDEPRDQPAGTDPDSGVAVDPVCRKEEPDA